MDFCKISLEHSGMYTIPISELVKKHKLNYHLYAGDTQTYVAFKNDDIDSFTDRFADYVSDISIWMERYCMNQVQHVSITLSLTILRFLKEWAIIWNYYAFRKCVVCWDLWEKRKRYSDPRAYCPEGWLVPFLATEFMILTLHTYLGTFLSILVRRIWLSVKHRDPHWRLSSRPTPAASVGNILTPIKGLDIGRQVKNVKFEFRKHVLFILLRWSNYKGMKAEFIISKKC